MNVKNNVKKVFAVAASAAMLGMTMVGALAYSLSDYPAPFVQSGVFNGAIVVGQNAQSTDVLGAIDIAASLQAEAVTPVSSGSAVATTTVQGGVLFDDNGQDINLRDTLSKSFDDQDFSVLADGTLVDDNGAVSDDDYSQLISVGDSSFKYETPSSDDYTKPVLYLDTASNELNFALTFDDAVNFSAYTDGESFDMFGKTFTIKKVTNPADDLVLYASDNTQIVTMGTPVTAKVDGTEHTISIEGATSDGVINLAVDGETHSMEKGNTRTINGVEIYVQDVFISNIAGESAAAKIFIGSEEWNLGNSATPGDSLKIDGETVDGVTVSFTYDTTSDLEHVNSITFTEDMSDMQNEALTDKPDYDWVADGDTFVDPVFGFKLSFTEALPELDASSRVPVEFKATSNKATIDFTNNEGTEYSWDVYKVDSSNLINNNHVVFITAHNDSTTNKTSVSRGDAFLAVDDFATSKPVSVILEYKGWDDNDKPYFEDVETGKIYKKEASGDHIKGTNVLIVDNSNNEVNLTRDMTAEDFASSEVSGTSIYTKNNYRIDLFNASNTFSAENITVTEDSLDINHDDDSTLDGDFNVQVSVDNGDMRLDLQSSSYYLGDGSDDDGNVNYALSKYGTYIKEDADDHSYVNLNTLGEEMDLNVYMAPPDATTVTSAATGDAYQVNPITSSLGLGVLDVDTTLGSKPLIVVGGPYVNTIAAELMGNPDQATIESTFTEGKALIHYYDDKQAMLVAGYGAQDTQGACYVVAHHNDYAFAGNELEVVVTDSTHVSVI